MVTFIEGVSSYYNPPLAVDGDSFTPIVVSAKVCGHLAGGSEGVVKAAVSVVTCQGEIGKCTSRCWVERPRHHDPILAIDSDSLGRNRPRQSLWSPCHRYRKSSQGCRQCCNAPGRSCRRHSQRYPLLPRSARCRRWRGPGRDCSSQGQWSTMPLVPNVASRLPSVL